MKEPGQMAWRAYANLYSFASAPQWHELPTPTQRAWAAVEATIRADERARTVEECAKVVEDWPPSTFNMLARDQEMADAIRASLKKEVSMSTCQEIRNQNRALKRRIKDLEKFARKVAYGPPHIGQPTKLLNRFVDQAQKLVPKDA